RAIERLGGRVTEVDRPQQRDRQGQRRERQREVEAAATAPARRDLLGGERAGLHLGPFSDGGRGALEAARGSDQVGAERQRQQHERRRRQRHLGRFLEQE